MKYKRQARINDCAETAEILGVPFRCSQRGISILGVNENKFFDGDELLVDKSRCIKFIKQQADPSLQTYFI